MTATNHSSTDAATDLTALRDKFRDAVISGQSGAVEYAAWTRECVQQAAAVRTHNQDEAGRVNAANNALTEERGWLSTEARTLESNRDKVDTNVTASVGGNYVDYTAELHNGRVATWRERLAAYTGHDCSDVQPAYGCVPFIAPRSMSLMPAPAPAPREYGVELSAVIAESLR